MAIKIITDSTSDISLQEAEKIGVSIVPLKVIIDDKQYEEAFEITPEKFYPLLESAEVLPTTSQPAPKQFLAHFQEAKEKGDYVIAVVISGKISGTFQSATLASDMSGYDRIHVVDSLSASIGLRLLVEYAVKLRDEGKTAEEIVNVLEDAKHRLRLLAMVDTLKYLHKGGRLSKGSAVVGSLLKIKPVVTLRDGTLEMLTKARGTKNAVNVLFEELVKYGELDANVPVYLGYTKDATQCEAFRERGIANYGLKAIATHPVGCVIGTHTGPGAVLLVCLEAAK